MTLGTLLEDMLGLQNHGFDISVTKNADWYFSFFWDLSLFYQLGRKGIKNL